MPDPAELRDFLKANCTAVAPGETLVVQTRDLTPNQMREFTECMNMADPDGTPWLPFRTVVVPGEGLGVVRPAELKAALRELVRDEIGRYATHERLRNPIRIPPAPR